MPYATVSDLPPAVRSKLKTSKKRRQWLHVWNSSYDRHGDESRAFAEAWATIKKAAAMSDFSFYMPLSKVQKNADGSCTITGYASTPAKDLDGEVVTLDAIKTALPGYMEWRNLREMHQPSAVGRTQEANVDTKGLFIRGRVTDPTAVQKCIDKVYQGLSIGGRKLNKVGDTITGIELVEISLVDRPANPECRFDVAKKAKDSSGAYLLKIATRRSAEEKAVSKMAQAVELLSKRGSPPAARDGFSLPAPPAAQSAAKGELEITHHSEDCDDDDTKDTKKRDVSTQERQSLADRGQALPTGGFPIKNKDDLNNARRAFGRAKDKPATRRLISRRARELGVKLPDKWSKKWARKLLDRIQKLDSGLNLSKSARPSFLTLGADSKGKSKLSHGLAPGLELEQRNGSVSRKAARRIEREFSLMEKNSMSKQEATEDDLGKMILALAAQKRDAAAPRMSSRQKRFQIAQSNMRKARGARKNCAAAIEAAHKVLKAAYLAKVAELAKRGKKPDDDDDDDDIGKAMRSLNKAYGELGAMKTFMKAVSVNIKKAAGRSGQRGQEVGDSGFSYEVPRGVRSLSPSDLSTASPGGEGSGSEPPLVNLTETFPGKMAKRYSKYVSPEVAEMMAKLAASEAQNEILKSLPAGPTFGKKPYAFDVSKLNLGREGDATSVFEGVNPNGLVSDDENIRKEAVGKVIGNMILQGHGRSVFDSSFHGTAGAA
jgi:hypothetical protein